MRTHPCPDGSMGRVTDAELPTGRLHDARERAVVDMTHAWQKMMLDLEVQPSQQPVSHQTAAGEVHGGFGLMFRPGLGQMQRTWLRLGEVRFLHAMSQLENDADDNA